MSLELFIARRMRLRRPGNDGRRSSAGTVIAVTGIAVSFIVMLLSVVVMLGFKHEIKSKIAGFDSQLIVYPQPSKVTGIVSGNIELTTLLQQMISETLPESDVKINIATPVIFKTADDFQGMIIRGIDVEQGDSFIESNLIRGVMPDLDVDSISSQVVIPAVMASRLLLDVGDKIQAYFVSQNSVKVRNMEVSGIFDTHFSDYDKVYAFARTDFLQDVTGLERNQGSTISINNLGDDEAIDQATTKLENTIYQRAASNPDVPLYELRNIHSTGAAYFSWLALLDTNVVVILILMAVVSGFTLVSSLFIIILEQVNMIGILKALGMSTWSIVKIFIYVAERLVIRGLLMGNVIAILLIAVQWYWHILPLDPESYYLNFVPVEFDCLSWGILNLGVIVMAALVLLAPAKIIASIKPSTAIRFE